MRRILSMILLIGLLCNVVIPAYASDDADIVIDPLTGKPKWTKYADYGCATFGSIAYAAPVICANPVGGAVCMACAGWAVVSSVWSLIER